MGRLRFSAAVLPLILILAACSGGAGATPSPTTAPSQPTASQPAPSTAPSAAPSAAAEAYPLKVAAGSGAVTNYLTAEDGRTLYIFKNDTAGSGKSTCYEDCAKTWPPLLVDSLDELQPDSAVTGKIALIARTDGDEQQVTYNGWPLYYYAGDKKAGDTAGQGLFGKWFVAPASAETTDAYPLKVAAGSGAVMNYLTAENGKTLYQFKNDTVNSGKSTCNGDCAKTWPPFVVDSLDEVKPDSAITGKLALITRDDGTKQVSYKGWPLYYYAGDKKAGDTAGQGLFGKWFVVNP